MRNFIFFLFLLPTTVFGKLLDKIALVIDGQTMTLSAAQRVSKTYDARSEISPQLYPAGQKKELADVIKTEIQTQIIRKKLGSLSYVISDDQTEAQIQSTEKRLGLTREALLGFLESRGINFEEYFEITRATIEFNLFYSRVIAPLITVTDQEIKNEFYHSFSSNNLLSFKYNLNDYSIDLKEVSKSDIEQFPQVLKAYTNSGILPEKFKKMSVNTMGEITQDGISPQMRDLLKMTDEGSFSTPIVIGQEVHVFFVNKKDLVESELFIKEKEKIRVALLEKRAKQVSELWFKRETENHYIKIQI